jgi:hypothetical protein
MAQKIVQYQAVLQLAQGAPQLYDMPYLHRQMLEVLGIKNAEKLVPLKDGDDMKPRDPISENMDVINGKPVITRVLPVDRAIEAFNLAADKSQSLKVQIQFAPEAA